MEGTAEEAGGPEIQDGDSEGIQETVRPAVRWVKGWQDLVQGETANRLDRTGCGLDHPTRSEDEGHPKKKKHRNV